MMKQILFGTTALVAASVTAAAVQAQNTKPMPIKINVTGFFQSNFSIYDIQKDGDGEAGANLREHGLSKSSEIIFKGSTTLDNGLQFGVNIQLEGDTCRDQIDESFLFVEGVFGRIELGATSGVGEKQFVGAPTPIINHGVNTPVFFVANALGSNLAFSPSTINIFGNGDSEKINYFSPKIAGFQLALSYAPDGCEENGGGGAGAGGGAVGCGGSFGGLELDNSPNGQQSEIFEAALSFNQKFGDVDLSVYGAYGQGRVETASAASKLMFDDAETFAVGFSVAFDGFTVGGGYRFVDNLFSARNTEQRDFNIGIAYQFGDFTVAAAYQHTEVKDKDGNGAVVLLGNPAVAGAKDELDGFSVGVIYDLGAGIALTGGVQYFDFDTNANDPNRTQRITQFVVGTKIDF